MNDLKIRYVIGFILAVCMIGLAFSPAIKHFVAVPTSMTVFEGSEELLMHNLEGVESKETSSAIAFKNQGHRTYLSGEEAGNSEVVMTVGKWPVKAIDVSVLPKIEVVPGGQSIGVKLNTEGVLVVGHHLIEKKGQQLSPGEDAGIKVGDMITKLDGVPIHSMNEVAELVQQAGKEEKDLKLEVRRNQKTFETTLTPEKATGDHLYRMGLYIRDSAAGVGTLTFYEPKSGKYGALGHVIADTDTHKAITVHDGEVMRSSVTSIEKGLNGEPGEKLARISQERDILGNIEKNSSFGIFGKLNKRDLKNDIADKPLPISSASEVKKGPAQMLTVVDGEKVEKFDIEIVNSITQATPATKGMVIKVTDKRLLEETGGIVQGMSGSPIIQNGKIIGAVTHVFVNDPTSGYACHIGWMLEEAGLHTGLVQAKAS
ncbi:SpoIVB peptidase [Bacillus sp. FSL W7-1360]